MGYCRYVTALVKVEATVTLANDSVKIFTERMLVWNGSEGPTELKYTRPQL